MTGLPLWQRYLLVELHELDAQSAKLQYSFTVLWPECPSRPAGICLSSHL